MALEAFLSLFFQCAWRRRFEVTLPTPRWNHLYLRPATTLVFWRLQVFVSLPIVKPWRRGDDDFLLRPGRIRDRGGARVGKRRVGGGGGQGTSFAGQIQQAIRRAGGNPSRLGNAGKGGGRFNERGRGASASAMLKNRKPWSRDGGIRTRSRRVAVKARVVKLNPQRGAARGRQFVNAKAVDAQLRLSAARRRDQGRRKRPSLSASQDVEDGPAFVERGREDRRTSSASSCRPRVSSSLIIAQPPVIS